MCVQIGDGSRSDRVLLGLSVKQQIEKDGSNPCERYTKKKQTEATRWGTVYYDEPKNKGNPEKEEEKGEEKNQKKKQRNKN